MKNIIPLILFGLSATFCQAQGEFNFRSDFKYHIVKAQEPVELNGLLDEDCWNDCDVAGNFWQKAPFYSEAADPLTEVKLSYDDNYLYVAAKCYQKEDIIIQSLKRDQFWDNTGIAIVLDPLNSKTNSYLFGSSALGVQWDAFRTETSDINEDWSNKWSVATRVTPEYWTAEFAIPFKILRYNQRESEWGLNFVRNVMFCNEYHNWTAVPEGFWPPNAAFAGSLVWDQIPDKKSGNFNIIPYISTGVIKEKNQDTDLDIDFGADAKIALNSSLNLDLSYNPDFSQIEADEIVTNLTRFDISLPEKRTFFLENADLFADFGGGGVRPFFSRKIGLDENFQTVPILYGARLTGNLSKYVRVGVLNIHSKNGEETLGQNQSAISFRRQFGRSFVQGMFLNRQAFDGSESVSQDYGRNVSLESMYLTKDGKLSSWLGLHRSFKPDISSDAGMYNTGFQFVSPSWEILTDFLIFQENYFTDMGFSPRVNNYDAERDTIIRMGYNKSYTTIDYRIRPQEGNIAQHQFGFENLTHFNPDWSFNEQYNRLRYFLALKSKEEINFRFNYSDIELQFPFSFTGAEPLPTDRYKNIDFNIEYVSDNRKAFSYELEVQTGGFYNGRLSKFAIEANYRIQPWANFGVEYQWNDLSFPDPYGANKITALVSKIEIGFNKNLLWTTLFQYVDQSNFVGLNSRLQWRFSPMSDIFLVYLDNYDLINQMDMSRSFESNNRALVLKINYWH